MGFLYFSVPLAGVSWALFLVENIYYDLTGKNKVRENKA
jgi:TRAP-type C4-dicarboxylate transport system permease small subunit